MSRFSHYDTDEERLPEGMTRIGYDADEQVYTFRDADGSIWESAPGCQYGQLTKVGDGNGEPDAGDAAPFLGPTEPYSEPSWRRDMRPLLNFGVLVGLFLIFLFWFLHWSAGSAPMEPIVACAEGTSSYTVQNGDTCWDIANNHNLSVDDLIKNNFELDCNALNVDSQICLPNPPPSDDGTEEPTA